MQWSSFFPDEPLTRPYPTFDGRCVLYPKRQNLRDYLRWRQVDCHINNLYNTTFWALVQQGNMSGTEAELFLKGTLSKDKNEILFSRFGINYNNEEEVYKKGTTIYRDYPDYKVQENEETEGKEKQLSKTQAEKERKRKLKAVIKVEHVDVIKDEFWDKRPWLLANSRGRLAEE
ncbi:hypothetical protein MBLNU457_2023t3 [Dothideomycetes sp. NU457]